MKNKYVVGFNGEGQCVYGEKNVYLDPFKNISKAKLHIMKQGFSGGKVTIFQLVPILTTRETANYDIKKYTWRKP